MRRRVATVGGLAALGSRRPRSLWPAAGQEPAVASAERGGSGCSVASVPVSNDREDLRRSLRCLINQERAIHGFGKLARNTSLQKAAQRHTKTMVATDCLAHRCPGEVELDTRLEQAGYFDGAQKWRLRREHRLRAEHRGDGRQLDGERLSPGQHPRSRVRRRRGRGVEKGSTGAASASTGPSPSSSAPATRPSGRLGRSSWGLSEVGGQGRIQTEMADGRPDTTRAHGPCRFALCRRCSRGVGLGVGASAAAERCGQGGDAEAGRVKPGEARKAISRPVQRGARQGRAQRVRARQAVAESPRSATPSRWTERLLDHACNGEGGSAGGSRASAT